MRFRLISSGQTACRAKLRGPFAMLGLVFIAIAAGACSLGVEPDYTALMRNDSQTAYLVDFRSDHVAWVFSVPGNSSVQLESLHGALDGYSAVAAIYLTDCTKVATVELTKELHTVYVDPHGAVSARAHRDLQYQGPVSVRGEGTYQPGCSG
jgi:hypothetical protein